MGLKITICSGDRPPMRTHLAVTVSSGQPHQAPLPHQLQDLRATRSVLRVGDHRLRGHIYALRSSFSLHTKSRGSELEKSSKHFVFRWASHTALWLLLGCFMVIGTLLPSDHVDLSISPSPAFFFFFPL